MNRENRPSLAALRSRVQKDRHREIGNWLARRVARPTAVYGTWLAVRLGLSANQVTLLALFAALASAIAMGTGSRAGFVLGVVLAQLFFWLDHVDGQVARWRKSSSLDGVYFDYLMHHVVALTQGFALGYGLAARSGDPRWAIAGFAIASGWTLLSLHNDCRYKALFQRLKSDTCSYLVDAGSAGRPAPPMGWPGSGWRTMSWPAYKACEYHIVLISLTILAFVAILAPGSWLVLWRCGVISMAVAAPILASARVARTVRRGLAEAEFSRWFRPFEPKSTSVVEPSPCMDTKDGLGYQ